MKKSIEFKNFINIFVVIFWAMQLFDKSGW